MIEQVKLKELFEEFLSRCPSNGIAYEPLADPIITIPVSLIVERAHLIPEFINWYATSHALSIQVTKIPPMNRLQASIFYITPLGGKLICSFVSGNPMEAALKVCLRYAELEKNGELPLREEPLANDNGAG